MSLKGVPGLLARIKAVKLTFKPYGRTWADETARQARSRVPNRNTKWSTGRLHDSIRRKNATQRKATVVGHYTGNFIDADVKAHDITPRGRRLVFRSDGRTIFAKKVHKPRTKGNRFKSRSAHAALKRYPIRDTMIQLWNAAD